MTDSLLELAAKLVRITIPIIMVIGIIGNSLNIAVLTRSALCKHASSRYFLSLAINNLFVTSIILFSPLFALGYQRDITTISLLSCKLVSYFLHVSVVLSTYFIVLASIDRYCASSTSVRLRNCSNIKVAQRAILFVLILIMLFYINTPILIDLQSTDAFGCAIRADTIYKTIYPMIQAICFAIIAPLLMIIFGLLTIHNTKQLRVIPVAMSRHRRTENQLAAMLLLQVSTYIVLTLPASVTYIIMIFPNTIQTTLIFYFVTITSQLLFYSSFATPFLLYIISARTYRKELIRLIYKIFRIHDQNQIHPITNTVMNATVHITRRLSSKH